MKRLQRPARRRGPQGAAAWPAEIDAGTLADRLTYHPSPEHKGEPVSGVPPHPRADATVCPSLAGIGGLVTVLRWLRDAVRAKHAVGPWENGFPRYVYHRTASGEVFAARLTNAGKGEYKGYPVRPDEVPASITRLWKE